MKKTLVTFFLSLSVFLFSQVGISTSSPAATLDVVAQKTDGTTPEGVIAPRLTGDQIKSANSKYQTAQTGAIVYATSPISSSDSTGKTSNITAAGYYYFDGTVWVSLSNNNYFYEDATRFLGGTIYSIYDTNSGGTLDRSKVIGGVPGTVYTVGGVSNNIRSAVGGINSIKGNGYTISNPANGIFDIKFNEPLKEIYGISVNILDSYGYWSYSTTPNPNDPGMRLNTLDNSQVSFISNTILRIKIGNSLGAFRNRSFTFLVTGK